MNQSWLPDAKPGKKSRDNPEERLQRAIWQHIVLRAPKNIIAYAVPNGIPSSPRTGARFKAMGLVPGIFDMAFVLADLSPAFLEIKVKGGRLSQEQKAFEAKCERMGIEYAVVYGIDSALQILTAWGVLPPDLD